jgi:hypothetical protein
MTAAVSTFTEKQARRLVELSKQHLGNFERCLAEIIETRAWEVLGYESFPEFYAGEYSEFTLFPEMRPHVVYAYFDSGASVEDVASSIRGVGPELAKGFKRQRDNGVPAEHAKPITVAQHGRERPGPRRFLTLEFSATELREFERLARSCGTTANDVATAAVTAAFKAMAER